MTTALKTTMVGTNNALLLKALPTETTGVSKNYPGITADFYVV